MFPVASELLLPSWRWTATKPPAGHDSDPNWLVRHLSSTALELFQASARGAELRRRGASIEHRVSRHKKKLSTSARIQQWVLGALDQVDLSCLLRGVSQMLAVRVSVGHDKPQKKEARHASRTLPGLRRPSSYLVHVSLPLCVNVDVCVCMWQKPCALKFFGRGASQGALSSPLSRPLARANGP